jgi:hypothetical protein
LALAGVVAFIAYAVLGSVLLSDDPEFEITIFTILFQGVAYLLMMGVSNLCFFLGPLSEKLLSPTDPQRFPSAVLIQCPGGEAALALFLKHEEKRPTRARLRIFFAT